IHGEANQDKLLIYKTIARSTAVDLFTDMPTLSSGWKLVVSRIIKLLDRHLTKNNVINFVFKVIVLAPTATG
ncbi:hypothetical protein, partial [Photobacterium halotolerans]